MQWGSTLKYFATVLNVGDCLIPQDHAGEADPSKIEWIRSRRLLKKRWIERSAFA